MKTKAKEMYDLQKYFGTYEVNLILGDFKSYKQLRVHTRRGVKLAKKVLKLLNMAMFIAD